MKKRNGSRASYGTIEEIERVYDTILAIDPSIIAVHGEPSGQVYRTLAIRSLMKELGLKVSVQKATGANCYWTYVYLPRIDGTEKWDLNETLRLSEKHDQAKGRLENIIDAAFPSFVFTYDPWSDYQTFVYTVN